MVGSSPPALSKFFISLILILIQTNGMLRCFFPASPANKFTGTLQFFICGCCLLLVLVSCSSDALQITLGWIVGNALGARLDVPFG